MKNVIWETFEILVNFYQGFIMTYFVHAYLGNKHKKSFLKSSGVIYAIALAIIITAINHIMAFENILAFSYVVLLLIYALIHLYGSFQKKLFAALYSVAIILIPSALVTNILAVILNTEISEIYSNQNANRLITIIIGQLVILYFFIISLRLFVKNSKKEREPTQIEWLLISLVLIISIAIGSILNEISMEISESGEQIYLILAILGLILINVVVCYLVSELGKKNETLRENELLKLQQEYSKQYIKNASVEYDTLRKLRHDFKNNYSVIYTLFSENKNEKGLKFIDDCVAALSETETFIHTDNDVVNAVINTKLSSAKLLGIECTCLSVKTFNGIDDTDLCRLLSNMLENAVTACARSEMKDKCIRVKISSDEYNYTFNVKNTIDKSVITDNPQLETTKENANSHGLGTKIIRDISLKYNGQCDFYEEGDFFCCNVVLARNSF